MDAAIQFWNDHQVTITAITLWLLSGIFNFLTRFKTPEEWVEFGERYPRIQNVIRAIRALGLDPVKLISVLGEILTHRAAASKSDRPKALQAAEKDSK
jgi:hypothetical protein